MSNTSPSADQSPPWVVDDADSAPSSQAPAKARQGATATPTSSSLGQTDELATDGDLSAWSAADIARLTEAKVFLAGEFLLWLWFTAETHGPMELASLQSSRQPVTIDLWVRDKIVFEASKLNAMKQSFTGGLPSQSPEVALALKSGKKVGELRLGVDVEGHGEFRFGLSSGDMALRSLKLPDIDDDLPEIDGGLYPVRIQQLELISDIFDRLFYQFLLQRTAPDWKDNLWKDLREWIQKRDSGSDGLLN